MCLATCHPKVCIETQVVVGYEVVCNSIACAWNHLKFGKGKDNYVATNVVKTIIVSTIGSNMLATRKCIGFNRKTLLELFIIGIYLMLTKIMRFGQTVIENQKNTDVKDLVAKWYLKETKTSRNMDNVVGRLIGHRC